MKQGHLAIILMIFSFGCEEEINIDYGPCKFAPAESKFTVFPNAYCTECYFELEVFGKQYSFTGNQFLESPPWEINTISNGFLQFSIVVPFSVDSLNLGLGNKTPLLKSNPLPNSRASLPPISAAFGIYNYCKDYFEPIGNIDQSYHILTRTELVDSYFVENDVGDSDDYQFNFFYAYGELRATFNMNGETQVATAMYKIRLIVYDKI